MRAEICSCGLLIHLVENDKKELEKKSSIECKLQGWKKPKLTLYIVDEVTKRGPLENPGFHIDVTPRAVSPEHREQYDIYLSKEHFQTLTNPESWLEGGYYISRSLYDRVEFIYLEIKKPKS